MTRVAANPHRHQCPAQEAKLAAKPIRLQLVALAPALRSEGRFPVPRRDRRAAPAEGRLPTPRRDRRAAPAVRAEEQLPTPRRDRRTARAVRSSEDRLPIPRRDHRTAPALRSEVRLRRPTLRVALRSRNLVVSSSHSRTPGTFGAPKFSSCNLLPAQKTCNASHVGETGPARKCRFVNENVGRRSSSRLFRTTKQLLISAERYIHCEPSLTVDFVFRLSLRTPIFMFITKSVLSCTTVGRTLFAISRCNVISLIHC